MNFSDPVSRQSVYMFVIMTLVISSEFAVDQVEGTEKNLLFKILKSKKFFVYCITLSKD